MRLVEFAERVDVHFGRVQHRLEIGVVERDGLAVAVDRLLVVALQGGDVAEQVVRLGRLGVELERAPGALLGAARVAALHEIPAAVEVRRKLVHQERLSLVLREERVKLRRAGRTGESREPGYERGHCVQPPVEQGPVRSFAMARYRSVVFALLGVPLVVLPHAGGGGREACGRRRKADADAMGLGLRRAERRVPVRRLRREGS